METIIPGTDRLFGLVLAGGESRRMGRDKALLLRDGQTTFLQAAFDLLGRHCSQVFVSIQTGQRADMMLPSIPDLEPGLGPLGGIMTALAAHDTPWLVLACDLPLVNDRTLLELIAGRDATKIATCFVDAQGLPEPLCAIYEPAALPVLRASSERKVLCPRKILLRNAIRTLNLPDENALANCNTPLDFAAISDHYF